MSQAQNHVEVEFLRTAPRNTVVVTTTLTGCEQTHWLRYNQRTMHYIVVSMITHLFIEFRHIVFCRSPVQQAIYQENNLVQIVEHIMVASAVCMELSLSITSARYELSSPVGDLRVIET